MARSHEELARFRGNDKLYCEGWDHIFNKKVIDENETRDASSINPSGVDLRHPIEDVTGICPEHADERENLLRETPSGC